MSNRDRRNDAHHPHSRAPAADHVTDARVRAPRLIALGEKRELEAVALLAELLLSASSEE